MLNLQFTCGIIPEMQNLILALMPITFCNSEITDISAYHLMISFTLTVQSRQKEEFSCPHSYSHLVS